MTTPADLSVLTANATSPIRDSRFPSGNRITVDSVTIDAVGSSFGAAPNVTVFRDGTNGDPGDLLPLTGTSTEPGNITNTGGVSKYQIAPDGFSGITARELGGGLFSNCQLQHLFADCTEIRIEKMEIIPNHYAYPMRPVDADHGKLETFSSSSVSKDDWVMCDTDGSGVSDKNDIAVTTTNSSKLYVSGNATQPGIGSLVDLADFLDFHAPYSKGVYMRFGAPDPNVDLGRIEVDLTSRITGTSKSTGTKTINADVVLNAVGPVALSPEYCIFNCIKAFAYIELGDGEHEVQLLRRFWFVASGTGTCYQCAYLTNNAVWEDATWKTAVVATAWSDSQITVPINDYAKTMATHVIIRKPDGSMQAKAI